MTCNLLNYEKELNELFEVVSGDNVKNRWCIYEYDGGSNIIRPGPSGDSGIEGLIENLSAGKLQYGFCSFKSGSQNKILLIHWQGEGVPAVRRSQTAPHVAEVRNFVRSVHLTISARNEDEIDVPLIIKQLTGANNGFNGNFQSQNERTNKPSLQSLPNNLIHQTEVVNGNGTAQKAPRAWVPPPPKTVAAMNNGTKAQGKTPADVDLDERSKFWKEMRAEEEQRRKEEAERREEQQKRYAVERRQLETQLHEALLVKNAAMVVQKSVTPVGGSSKKTASDLIAGRRLIFEQKLAELAATIPKPLTKPKNFRFQVGVAKPVNDGAQIHANNSQNVSMEANGIETPNLSVKSALQQFQRRDAVEQPRDDELPRKNGPQKAQEQEWNKEPEKATTISSVESNQQVLSAISQSDNSPVAETQQSLSEQNLPQTTLVEQMEALSMQSSTPPESISVKALWDYQAEDTSEITFDPGDVITDVEMLHDGWWRGRAKNGAIGLFPSNFVEIL